MPVFYRNKLWQGKYIDLRSYERDDAIKNKKDIVLVLQEEDKIIGKMTLTVAKLKKKSLIKSQTRVPSKVYLGQYYNLLSYEWIPDKVISKEDWERQYLI